MKEREDPVAGLGDALGALLKLLFRQTLPLSDGHTAVTHEQYGVLHDLARTERQLTMGELAAARSLGLAGATAIVDRLVAAGLVIRTADPGDRRLVRVGLSGAGRDFQAGLREARLAELGRLLDQLGPGERESLLAALPAFKSLARLCAARQPAAGSPG